MSTAPSGWAAWKERLVVVDRNARNIEDTLYEVAGEIAATCGRKASPARRWASAGVAVRETPMRGRGRCDLSSEASPVVYVNISDNRYAQHFTVAHELGHMLIDSLPVERRREMSYAKEEELCDDIAQRMIVPPDELAEELSEETPPTPPEVLRLCGTFESNPSTMLRALGTRLSLGHSAYLLARLRPHRLRPAETGFRIDAAVGPAALFWPFNKRIENLGLQNLTTAARAAAHGTFFEGGERHIAVPLKKVDAETGHNSMAGPVRWCAARQGWEKPYLLALVDCSRMQGERVERRESPDSAFKATDHRPASVARA